MATVLVLGDGSVELPAAWSMLPHEVSRAEAFESASGEVDVVVVDARTDLGRGRDTCTTIRTTSDVPVALLVNASALAVVQPTWGANSFVVDTAETSEVDARLRWLASSRERSAKITVGNLVIDEDAYTAVIDGRPLDLTYTEFELLKYLAAHAGRVLTRDQLLSEVWGYDYYGGTRTVDVHVRRLRAKLGPENEAQVTTVRNVGYRWSGSR